MRLRCPQCGSRLSLAAAEEAELAASLQEAAARCGRWLGLVNEYLAAFRASPESRLGDRKRLRLLQEVGEMLATGRLRYGGQEYQVRPVDLAWGLEQVANRELTGLKNHNYLKVVVLSRVRQGGQARPRPAAVEGPDRWVIEVPDD